MVGGILTRPFAIAALFLLSLTTPLGHASDVTDAAADRCKTGIALLSVDLDQQDEDTDGLSDCLENLLFGTLSERQDTDLDGVPDGSDLIPNVRGETDWALGVHVIKLREDGTKCDLKGARYWDPYVSTGWLKVVTQASGAPVDVTALGWGPGDHKDNREYDGVQSIVAEVTGLPQNINAFLESDDEGFPIGSFHLGLTDEDAFKDNGINLGAGDALWDEVPISPGPDGEPITKSFTGSGKCRGAITVTVSSPIEWTDLVTLTTPKYSACDCIRYRDVMERLDRMGSEYDATNEGYVLTTLDALVDAPETTTGHAEDGLFNAASALAGADLRNCQRLQGVFGHGGDTPSPSYTIGSAEAFEANITLTDAASSQMLFEESVEWERPVPPGEKLDRQLMSLPGLRLCDVEDDVVVDIQVNEVDGSGTRTLVASASSEMPAPTSPQHPDGPIAYYLEFTDDSSRHATLHTSWDAGTTIWEIW